MNSTNAITEAMTDVVTGAMTNAMTNAMTDAMTDAVTDAMTHAVTDATTDALANTPPHDVHVIRSVMSVTLMSLGVATFLLNLFVLSILGAFPWMRSIGNLIICSMAVTDLLAGGVTFIAGAVKWTDWFSVRGLFCQVFYTLDGLFAMASIMHVPAVNAERYIAIIFPLKYKHLVSARRTWAVLAGIWIVSLAQAIAYTLSNALGDQCVLVGVPSPGLGFAILVTSVGVPFITVICIYIHIATVVVNKLRFMAKSSNLDHAALARSQRKMFVTISAILGAWIVCWFPLMCVLLAMYFSLVFQIELDMDRYVVLYYFVEVMSYGNSLLNPILYFLTSRDFRKAGGLLLKCKRQTQAPSMSAVTESTHM